jgi:hypothetical protein
MDKKSWLSTKTEKCCHQCGKELMLVEPTDVLAARPIEVDLICPVCNAHCRAELTMEQIFQSIYPHLIDVSTDLRAENDNGFLSMEGSWNSVHVPLTHSEPPPSGILH